jgi:HlyD family secretion protein
LKIKFIIISFLLLLLVVSISVFLGRGCGSSNELFYSGTIEATQADLSFQTQGRVLEILVDEGSFVSKGQTLARLDQSELIARVEQAKAGLDSSIKELQQLKLNLELYKTNLPADVKRAEAGVEALKAQLKEFETGYRDQDVEKGRLAMLSAETAMKTNLKERDRIFKLYKDHIVSEKNRDNAVLAYETSLRAYEQAKENYRQLKEGYRPENITAAKARLKEGEAVLTQARKSLLKIDVAEKMVEAAEARVTASESALKLADIQLSYATLKSPFKGTITSRNIEIGEYVSPGREVFSMADLSTVDLKIFVDEKSIGKIKYSQDVDVKVDTFPDKVFKGKVAFISPESEFTPKIIQTHKERVKLVYLVKVLIPNPDLDLKPGMPADAKLKYVR